MRRSTKSKAAFTLVEMIVYVFCASLVLTAIYAILITSMRDYNAGLANVEIQQSAQNAIHLLSNELAESDPGGLTYYASGPTGIVFESSRDPSRTPKNLRQYVSSASPYTNCLISPPIPPFLGSIDPNEPYIGQPCWQKYICYYLISYQDPDSNSSEMELVRKEGPQIASPTPNPSAVPVSTPKTPSDFENNVGATMTPEIVARHIATTNGFTVSAVSGTSFLFLITINTTTGSTYSATKKINSFTTNVQVKVTD